MQIIGLDFGTSNTVCGFVENNDISIKESIPSAIFYQSRKAPKFGKEAVSAVQTVKGDGRLMRGFKSALGVIPLSQKTLLLPYDFVGEPLISDYETIFLQYFDYMKDHFGLKEVSGVMGRPVNFQKDPSKNGMAQSSLERLYSKIGFSDVTFEYEPIAAAYSHEKNLSKETLAAVIDIGGGTTDIAIMKLSNKNMSKKDRTDDILATSGTRIGGNDIDTILAQKYLSPILGNNVKYGPKNMTFGSAIYSKLTSIHTVQNIYQNTSEYPWKTKFPSLLQSAINESQGDISFKRLKYTYDNMAAYSHLSNVEKGKIKLCLNDEPVQPVDFDFGDLGQSTALFEKDVLKKDSGDVSKLYTEVSKVIRESIENANIDPKKIQLTILTGGGANIPLFQQMAKEFFVNAEVTKDNPLESVVTGLTLKAKNIYT